MKPSLLKLIAFIPHNRSTQQPWHSIFIAGYTLLFLIAIPCNLVVIFAGYRRYKKCKNGHRQRKRSELMRCLLIIYLAIFDISLCLTIPSTAIHSLTVFWPFSPNTEWMCRYTNFAPAMVIYSTSMMVIVIAADSFRNVVQPLKTQLTPKSLRYILPSVVITASIFAFPIWYSTTLMVTPTLPPRTDFADGRVYFGGNSTRTDAITYQYNERHPLITSLKPGYKRYNQSVRNENENNSIPKDTLKQGIAAYNVDEAYRVFCVEDWSCLNTSMSYHQGRIYYSIFSLIVQYITPFLAISILYIMVYIQLKKQDKRRNTLIIQVANEECSYTENARMKRNTRVHATMATFFCFCWLPQNLIYAGLDDYYDLFGDDPEAAAKISIFCHWIGMSSSCINPIIYGFWNTTIRTGRYLHMPIYTQ